MCGAILTPPLLGGVSRWRPVCSRADFPARFFGPNLPRRATPGREARREPRRAGVRACVCLRARRDAKRFPKNSRKGGSPLAWVFVGQGGGRRPRIVALPTPPSARAAAPSFEGARVIDKDPLAGLFFICDGTGGGAARLENSASSLVTRRIVRARNADAVPVQMGGGSP